MDIDAPVCRARRFCVGRYGQHATGWAGRHQQAVRRRLACPRGLAPAFAATCIESQLQERAPDSSGSDCCTTNILTRSLRSSGRAAVSGNRGSEHCSPFRGDAFSSWMPIQLRVRTTLRRLSRVINADPDDWLDAAAGQPRRFTLAASDVGCRRCWAAEVSSPRLSFPNVALLHTVPKHARAKPSRLPTAAKHDPRADDDHDDGHHQQHQCRQRHTGTPASPEPDPIVRLRRGPQRSNTSEAVGRGFLTFVREP